MKLPINQVKANPKNPRIIKDDKFKKLVKSLQDFPEMAEVREIVVNQDNVILGGNMRFKAMQTAGWKEVPVKIVDWTKAQQDEFMIKDNSSFGEWDWDTLANEWDVESLDDWGATVPTFLVNDGGIDHFRDADADSHYKPVDEYDNRTSNTLILIFNNDEFSAVVEELKVRIANEEGKTPSEVIYSMLVK